MGETENVHPGASGEANGWEKSKPLVPEVWTWVGPCTKSGQLIEKRGLLSRRRRLNLMIMRNNVEYYATAYWEMTWFDLENAVIYAKFGKLEVDDKSAAEDFIGNHIDCNDYSHETVFVRNKTSNIPGFTLERENDGD